MTTILLLFLIIIITISRSEPPPSSLSRVSGPATMVWSWLLTGVMTLGVASSLGEICSTFPVSARYRATGFDHDHHDTDDDDEEAEAWGGSPTRTTMVMLTSVLTVLLCLVMLSDDGRAVLLGVQAGRASVGALRLLDGRMDQPTRTGRGRGLGGIRRRAGT
jgi:hypothetical protein